ncbi:MAG TPA: TspO/MBR family protein [Allosphingosinicella sp.]|jgi:tryptophan-rich sensory protein|nr:TspO/MBR family protein [Allosphingosinicella sp.]
MTAIASKSQLRMSFLRYALFTVPLVLLLGTVSGRIANSGYGNAWFDALRKPEIMPPGWMFGAAWTILYILLGLSLALILHAKGARGRGPALSLFVLQLLLNYAWSPLFFAYHQVDAAFWTILAMIAISAVTAVLFWRIRRSAGLLMLPYLAWLCFAATLTWQIGTLNPGASELAPGGITTDIAL